MKINIKNNANNKIDDDDDDDVKVPDCQPWSGPAGNISLERIARSQSFCS